jgi:hypothetical protein
MIRNDPTQSIRTILLKDWDPLIVGDNPHLSDENDDLIPSRLIVKGYVLPDGTIKIGTAYPWNN